MSESQINVGNVLITVRYSEIIPDSQSVYPTLRFNINFGATQVGTPDRMIREIYLTNIKAEIFLGERNSLGLADPINSTMRLFLPAANTTCQFFLKLDHYGLAEIEKFRAGDNLQLRARVFFIVDSIDGAVQRSQYQPMLPIYVAKSDWVERLLPMLHYKEVLMVELPKLANTSFTDVTSHLQEAWRQQAMGAPDKVLTECRKALEGILSKVKEAGFEKEEMNEKGEKQKVPDWKTFFESESVSDVIGSINKKLRHFVAPASHFGKELSLTDSYFAIMLTHAMLYYIIERYQRVHTS